MLENVKPVTPETLLAETANIKFSGYKFVTLSCLELDEATIEILYHFDRDGGLLHFRLTVPRNALIPSISNIYQASFLAENEIQDLFGLDFSNLCIDFHRTLFLEDGIKSGPLCRYSLKGAAQAETPLPGTPDIHN